MNKLKLEEIKKEKYLEIKKLNEDIEQINLELLKISIGIPEGTKIYGNRKIGILKYEKAEFGANSFIYPYKKNGEVSKKGEHVFNPKIFSEE